MLIKSRHCLISDAKYNIQLVNIALFFFGVFCHHFFYVIFALDFGYMICFQAKSIS